MSKLFFPPELYTEDKTAWFAFFRNYQLLTLDFTLRICNDMFLQKWLIAFNFPSILDNSCQSVLFSTSFHRFADPKISSSHCSIIRTFKSQKTSTTEGLLTWKPFLFLLFFFCFISLISDVAHPTICPALHPFLFLRLFFDDHHNIFSTSSVRCFESISRTCWLFTASCADSISMTLIDHKLTSWDRPGSEHLWFVYPFKSSRKSYTASSFVMLSGVRGYTKWVKILMFFFGP